MEKEHTLAVVYLQSAGAEGNSDDHQFKLNFDKLNLDLENQEEILQGESWD